MKSQTEIVVKPERVVQEIERHDRRQAQQEDDAAAARADGALDRGESRHRRKPPRDERRAT